MKATEPYTPPASTTLIHGKNGIGGASAVSYTHLDVYKRQRMECAHLGDYRRDYGADGRHVCPAGDGLQRLAPTFASEQAADVYKRQGPCCGE